MSCPYYWYNYHYACRKSEKDVNEDIYDKYCSTSIGYYDCPIYKGNDTSGCFLTSACVETKGLPDDCRELTVLRTFRDNYLKSRPDGEALICGYYHCAPAIVEKIKASHNYKAIFDQIYDKLVLPCVKMIDAGDNEGALEHYREYTLQLKAQYL